MEMDFEQFRDPLAVFDQTDMSKWSKVPKNREQSAGRNLDKRGVILLICD
jgi:hypothetical protein